jgi:general secretion pathway protein E
MTDEVRRAVVQRAVAQEIQRCAVAAGMRTMFEDGLRKAATGVTTLEEVLRVTRES